MAWTLTPGESITRKRLHDEYGGVRQGGISPSVDTPNVMLFTDPTANAEHGYLEDRWVARDLFEYCGEGQSGHQEIRRYNRSVALHAADGKALRLLQWLERSRHLRRAIRLRSPRAALRRLW